jgi:hypothetical protein
MGLGAVCHTLNPRLFAADLEYIINHVAGCSAGLPQHVLCVQDPAGTASGGGGEPVACSGC